MSDDDDSDMDDEGEKRPLQQGTARGETGGWGAGAGGGVVVAALPELPTAEVVSAAHANRP